MPYGRRGEVEVMFREMEAQKHHFLLTKGKVKKQIWINGGIRLLPFGIIEYVFPRESLDIVLNTLMPDTVNRYPVGWIRTKILQGILKTKPLPKFSREEKFLWIHHHVNVIPIGIREDPDLVEPIGEYKGWTHEAI